MAKQSSIPSSVEALETMIIYLVEAVSKDYNISMETAKPKALELLSKSSEKLLGHTQEQTKNKAANKNEFQMNIKACKDVLNILKAELSNNQDVIKLLNRLEFHLKKLGE